MSNEIATTQSFDLTPRTLSEAMEFSHMLADSSIVPKDFMGKPGNVLVAMQWGMEIGLKPLQAMQNIAVINGRPSIWGDAALALVKSSPLCEDVIETYEGTGDKKKAVCVAKRKGRKDVVSEFSVADAMTAGLWKKSGPWTQYPDRMLKMRARSFALRDQFPDVLKGMAITEETMDTPEERDMGAASVVRPQTQALGNTAMVPDATLLKTAQEAAAAGMTAYQKFWAETGPANRKTLAGEHEALKLKASEADSARTVNNTAQQQDSQSRASGYSRVMENLLADLDAAADDGEEAFNTAWESLSDETKDALAGELVRLSEKAKRVVGQ